MKAVRIWFAIGLVMIFFQIIIGGVTRLTGSGLSITKWEIVTGTLPPMTEKQWLEEFEEYKQTPQYEKINEGMALSEFKFIYFWEYFHRLWARLMGFVFLLPFIYFIVSRKLTGKMLRQVFLLFFLAALVASFGWIMVASGLIERPWVNTYKLTLHLSLAILTFLYLWYLYFSVSGVKRVFVSTVSQRFLVIIFIGVAIQIMLGGIVSGAKAAMAFPTWPTMNGDWIPNVLMDSSYWHPDSFIDYDKNIFFPAFMQFVHRNLAYLLFILILTWVFRTYSKQDRNWDVSHVILVCLLLLQVLLGILVLLNSRGTIPVFYGVLHQGVGILLISTLLYQIYRVFWGDISSAHNTNM